MIQHVANAGKDWSPDDLRELEMLARSNAPARVIGQKLGRTPASIYAKARQVGIRIAPVHASLPGGAEAANQSNGIHYRRL